MTAAKDAKGRQQRGKHLELPTPSGTHPRLTTASSHLLPATALFHGPNSRNASYTSLNRSRDDRSTGTPVDKPQHLPRPPPPTSTFSGPRPNLKAGGSDRSSVFLQPSRLGVSKNESDFRADAVWAEMQKTLADVELSAMNSSHVFSATHAEALEELRTAQLGLAMAWAKSEADEGVDEEFGRDEQSISAVGQMRGGPFANAGSSPTGAKNAQGHSRQGSVASDVSDRGNLEQETERDIMLARRRREANDRYFKQVNSGVLNVVKKLDDVVTAMRQVEKESREIWNSSGESGREDMGDVTETDESVVRGRKRGETIESKETGLTTGTESEALTETPVEERAGTRGYAQQVSFAVPGGQPLGLGDAHDP